MNLDNEHPEFARIINDFLDESGVFIPCSVCDSEGVYDDVYYTENREKEILHIICKNCKGTGQIMLTVRQFMRSLEDNVNMMREDFNRMFNIQPPKIIRPINQNGKSFENVVPFSNVKKFRSEKDKNK
jgi:hypothetical protein